MIPRILIGVLVCAIVAWLLIGLRAVILEQQGIDAFTRSRLQNQRELTAARDDFTRAAELTPDHLPELLEVRLLAFTRRRGQALALARHVAEAEPASVEAWALVASLATPEHPALVAQARARLRALSPQVH